MENRSRAIVQPWVKWMGIFVLVLSFSTWIMKILMVIMISNTINRDIVRSCQSCNVWEGRTARQWRLRTLPWGRLPSRPERPNWVTHGVPCVCFAPAPTGCLFSSPFLSMQHSSSLELMLWVNAERIYNSSLCNWGLGTSYFYITSILACYLIRTVKILRWKCLHI